MFKPRIKLHKESLHMSIPKSDGSIDLLCKFRWHRKNSNWLKWSSIQILSFLAFLRHYMLHPVVCTAILRIHLESRPFGRHWMIGCQSAMNVRKHLHHANFRNPRKTPILTNCQSLSIAQPLTHAKVVRGDGNGNGNLMCPYLLFAHRFPKLPILGVVRYTSVKGLGAPSKFCWVDWNEKSCRPQGVESIPPAPTNSDNKPNDHLWFFFMLLWDIKFSSTTEQCLPIISVGYFEDNWQRCFPLHRGNDTVRVPHKSATPLRLSVSHKLCSV